MADILKYIMITSSNGEFFNLYQPPSGAFYVAKIKRIGYTSHRNLERHMRMMKVLCVMGALFLVGTSDVFAKSADSVVATQMTPTQAKTFIQNLFQDGINIIRQTRNINAEFKPLIKKDFEVGKIAKSSLGRKYKTVIGNDERKLQLFINSLINMLISVYTSKFDEYKAASLKISKAIQKSQNQITVLSEVITPGKASIKIVWVLQNGKVYNVIIDEVSIGNILRTTINDLIAKARASKKDFLEYFTTKYNDNNNSKGNNNYK